MIFTTILVRYTSLFLFEATLLATIGYNFRMSFDNGQESSCRYTETVTRYLDPVFAHSNAPELGRDHSCRIGVRTVMTKISRLRRPGLAKP
jgi:hypothetical protein